jgi:hypothetical protein
MLPRSLQIAQRAIVLVEGADEYYLIPELIRVRGLPQVQLIAYGGTSANLTTVLKAVVKLPHFNDLVTSLGVIKDADTNRDGAAQAVRSSLLAAGLKAPQDDLTIHNGPPRVAYLIAPKLGATGALEECLLESVAGHPALDCIDTLLGCVEQRTQKTIAMRNKAKVRALLAVRPEEPLNLVSEGAKAGLFPVVHEAFNDLARLIDLVGQAPPDFGTGAND